MIEILHLNAGARGATRLVHDDQDRFELLRRLAGALGGNLLAFCVMDTHLHVVAVNRPSDARGALAHALHLYARTFNARHRHRGPILRGPVEAIRAPSEVELARMIRYVHENPVRTRDPLVSTAVEYEWSSARAFAGLSRASFPDVERATQLLGTNSRRALGTPKLPLADLEPSSVPSAGPELILAAAAQAFGVAPDDVAANGRAEVLAATRAVFVTLGRLEAYRDHQLATVIGRTRERVTQLAAGPVDVEGVRIARTLLRTAALRVRLHNASVEGRQVAMSATGS